MQEEHQHGDRPAGGLLGQGLDGLDRMLKRAVVELHRSRLAGPGRSSPRLRLACTTSNPPDPSPRSRASTFTITSSPSCTSPIRPWSTQAGLSSSSIRTIKGSAALTTPLRSFSISGQPDRGFAYPQHLNDGLLGDHLLRGVIGLRPVGEEHRLIAGRHQGVGVAPAASRPRASARTRWLAAPRRRPPPPPTSGRAGSPGTSRSLGRPTSQPCWLAPQVHASTISPTVAAARSPSTLRASPRTRQYPATTLDAVRPRSSRRSPWSPRPVGPASSRRSRSPPRRSRCGHPRG